MKTSKMCEAIVIFLASALIAAIVAVAMLAVQYGELLSEREELTGNTDKLKGDIRLLIDDKREQANELYELRQDNERLAAAVRELRQINTELMNPEPVPDMALDEPKVEIVIDNSKERLPEDEMTNIFTAEPHNRFNPLSEQYALQQICYTESRTGLRCYFDGEWDCYYTAALAGAYGTTIGDAWRVTLKCGTVFNVMMGDFKHPIDNPSSSDFGDATKNYDGQDCISIIEFIADFSQMPDEVKQAGTYTALESFGGLYGDGGNVVKIEYLGRKWRP